MKVDIWSDVRCPFCYVGKKKFEKALDQFADADKVEVTWHSFQLDPNLITQADRNPYDYFSEAKRIPVQQAKAMHEHAKNAGREAGIDFNFDDSKVANSFKAHLLIQLAKSKGLADGMEEQLFQAQFIKGDNIDDEQTLIALAKTVGISEDEARSALQSEELAHDVAQDGLMARQLGINSVPFFCI